MDPTYLPTRPPPPPPPALLPPPTTHLPPSGPFLVPRASGERYIRLRDHPQEADDEITPAPLPLPGNGRGRQGQGSMKFPKLPVRQPPHTLPLPPPPESRPARIIPPQPGSRAARLASAHHHQQQHQLELPILQAHGQARTPEEEVQAVKAMLQAEDESDEGGSWVDEEGGGFEMMTGKQGGEVTIVLPNTSPSPKTRTTTPPIVDESTEQGITERRAGLGEMEVVVEDISNTRPTGVAVNGGAMEVERGQRQSNHQVEENVCVSGEGIKEGEGEAVASAVETEIKAAVAGCDGSVVKSQGGEDQVQRSQVTAQTSSRRLTILPSSSLASSHLSTCTPTNATFTIPTRRTDDDGRTPTMTPVPSGLLSEDKRTFSGGTVRKVKRASMNADEGKRRGSSPLEQTDRDNTAAERRGSAPTSTATEPSKPTITVPFGRMHTLIALLTPTGLGRKISMTSFGTRRGSADTTASGTTGSGGSLGSLGSAGLLGVPSAGTKVQEGEEVEMRDGLEVLPEAAKGWIREKDTWKPDEHSTECDHPDCDTSFTPFVRRHHCRRCGEIYCSQHSDFHLPLALHSDMLKKDEHGRLIRGQRRVYSKRVCEGCWDEVMRPEKKELKLEWLRKKREREQRRAEEEDDEAAKGGAFDGWKGFSASPVLSRQASVNSGHRLRARSSINGEDTVRRQSSSSNSRAAPRRTRTHTPLARYATVPGIITTSPSVDPTTPMAGITESPAKFNGTTPISPSMDCFSRAGSRRPSLTPVATGLPLPPRSPLPGEETNPIVRGELACYPLAANKSPGGMSHGSNCPPLSGYSSPNNPFSVSGGSTASLMELNSSTSSTCGSAAGYGSSRSHSKPMMRIHDMPKYVPPPPTEYLGNEMAAKLLRTPENEWVPELWGYERASFDPEISSSDEEGMDEECLRMRARPKLIVDGDIRYKAHPSPLVVYGKSIQRTSL